MACCPFVRKARRQSHDKPRHRVLEVLARDLWLLRSSAAGEAIGNPANAATRRSDPMSAASAPSRQIQSVEPLILQAHVGP
jgi:hypothetical protein